ncbi:hypothetical protein RF11_01218 [Thelohanellus kitauei]|uniref:TFIIS N-terminal domain-containing protein n=1 Tax=Thelohanellus kitauei TaxID=669202 RepID=A0A0C2I671_THEKT|nr:hypothetical protein RF11_01218 [Thelohanellus kitauei]
MASEELKLIAHSLLELLKVDPTGSDDPRVLELLKNLGEIQMTPRDLKVNTFKIIQLSRLAKIINDLRKQTTSAAIGAESRNLIKAWRDMVIKREGSFDSTQEYLAESQNSAASLTGRSDKSSDQANFSYNYIKKSLNLPDFSSFRVLTVEEPLPKVDIKEFLEREDKRFTNNLPEDLNERWAQLQKPTYRNDGSIAMPFISLDEMDFRKHRSKF